MKKYTINVTKTAIRKGKREHSFCCPVARACHAVGMRDIRVGRTELTRKSDGVTIAALPMRAQQFIRRFDHYVTRKTLKPFKFTLRIDPEKLKLPTVEDVGLSALF